MNRFYVTVPEGTMKLYYETEELCRKSFPNAIKIEPCNDSSFIEFVNKIKELSNEILFDYKGREIWVISTPYGDVLYRQYAGEDKSFIDGCEYQIHNFRLVEPVLWSISNPKDFYQDILTYLLSQGVLIRMGIDISQIMTITFT